MTDTMSRTSENRPHVRPPVNFSRPRPVSAGQKLHRDDTSYRDGARIYEAFYDSTGASLPVELPADVPVQAPEKTGVEVPMVVPAQVLATELPAELPAEIPPTRSLPDELPVESHASPQFEHAQPTSFFFPPAALSVRRHTTIDATSAYAPDVATMRSRRYTYEGSRGYIPPARSTSSSTTSTISDSTLSSEDDAAAAPTIPRTRTLPDPRLDIMGRASRSHPPTPITTTSSLPSSPRTSHEATTLDFQHSHPLRSHPPDSTPTLSPVPQDPSLSSRPPHTHSRPSSDNSHPLDDSRNSNSNSNSNTNTNSNSHSNISDKWTASDFDTSDLSPAELQKLVKKGINPALHAEMKAARKGRGKWGLGLLGGNLFLG